MINLNKNLSPIIKRNIKFKLLFNKYQIYGYLFIFLCTFLNSSSYLILYFMIEEKTISSFLLLLFFVTLGLSYLFVYPMRIFLVYSILYSRKILLEKFLIYLQDKILLFNEAQLKKKYTSLLRTNVSYVAKEYCDFYFHLILGLCALITSTFILFYIHGFIYVLVVLFTLFFVIICIKLISKEHRKLSSQMEDSENNLSQSLEASWDILSIKSFYSMNLFMNSLNNSFSGLEKKTIFQEKYYRLKITVISLIVILIFAITTFYLYLTKNFTIAQLVITLPILNSILSNILNIARELAFANNLEGRLESILKLQNLDEDLKNMRNKLIKRISFDKLKIINVNTQDEFSFVNFDEIELFFSNKKNDLYFIQGENGAGKSSILILLTNSFSNSIYFPTSPISLENNQESTGQMKSKYIINQMENSNNKILFLDEPYSNLSDKNEILDLMIKKSKKCLIVASVH